MLTNLHIVFFLFLCEHSWDPAGANFAIFQCCHHRFEANIQFHTQFLGHSLLIFVDELIETLFISWCDSCAWWSEMQLAFRSTAAFAEMHHSPPYCAHIHCWSPEMFSKHWWMSINAVFHAEKNLITWFCFVHTPMLNAITSDCSSAAICHVATKCKGIWWDGSTSTAMPPTHVSFIVDQDAQIGGITFRAAFLY